MAISRLPLPPGLDGRSRYAQRRRPPPRAGEFPTITSDELVPGTLAHPELFEPNGVLEVPLYVYADSGLTIPWKEYTGPDAGYTQGWAIAADSLQFTFTIDVLWRDFIAGDVDWQILGRSYVLRDPEEIEEPALHRDPPWTCPVDTSFVATKIVSVQGVQFLGQWAFAPISYYRLARVSILFQKVPYRILGGDAWSATDVFAAPPWNGQEYRRWCYRKMKGSGEFLTRQKWEMKWAQDLDGLDGVDGDFTIIQTPVSTEWGQYIAKEQVDFVWLDVPAEGLFGPAAPPTDVALEGRPAHQLDGIGKVNAAEFFGYPIEELLLDSVEFQERQSPVSRGALGLAGTEPCLAYDVIFHCLHLAAPAINPARAAGHNVTPYPLEEKWLAITTDGMLGDRTINDTTRIHRLYDFEKLFLVQ